MRQILTLIAALLLPGLVLADPILPARFDVTGVAGDDVLNLRAGPGTEFEIIGSLAPDATGVEVIGFSDDQGWAMVPTPEATAWASAAFLSPQPGQDAWHPLSNLPLTCIGNEPFWSLSFHAPGLAEFRSPDRAAETFDLSNFARSRNDLRSSSFNAVGSDGPILGTFRRGFCSDGMSDRTYGIRLELLFGGSGALGHLTGCCRLD